jgi:hypothetical protein
MNSQQQLFDVNYFDQEETPPVEPPLPRRSKKRATKRALTAAEHLRMYSKDSSIGRMTDLQH